MKYSDDLDDLALRSHSSISCNGVLIVRAQRSFLLVCSVAAALSVAASAANAARSDERQGEHAVFVMTNDANANEVRVFERDRGGSLRDVHSYTTGGRGSGGTIDPLLSQGSLTFSQDRKWLFAANAGSGTVSVFRVEGTRLLLTDEAPSGGAEPNAIASHGEFVYVLNTAGSSSVVGFHLAHGRLQRIENSLRFLGRNEAGSASIAFSPDGRFLVVTERSANRIDAFRVLANGELSEVHSNPSAAPGVFAATFSPRGTLLVSETGAAGADNASTVSSYAVRADLTLEPISTALPTLGAANCWNVTTPDGRFVYVSNAGSASIAGFAVASNGALTALPGTIVGSNADGATNLDIAVSADGAFLYSLNAGDGTIGVFAIDQHSGALTSLGATGHLPAHAGLNGIAAN
jgi:6-phosphogluconolactonase (cycloisomerase 2 family)